MKHTSGRQIRKIQRNNIYLAVIFRHIFFRNLHYWKNHATLIGRIIDVPHYLRDWMTTGMTYNRWKTTTKKILIANCRTSVSLYAWVCLVLYFFFYLKVFLCVVVSYVTGPRFPYDYLFLYQFYNDFGNAVICTRNRNKTLTHPAI